MREPRRFPRVWTWVWVLTALVAVGVVMVITRGVLEFVAVTAIVVLLVGGYALRRHARKRAIYDHDHDQAPKP